MNIKQFIFSSCVFLVEKNKRESMRRALMFQNTLSRFGYKKKVGGVRIGNNSLRKLKEAFHFSTIYAPTPIFYLNWKFFY